MDGCYICPQGHQWSAAVDAAAALAGRPTCPVCGEAAAPVEPTATPAATGPADRAPSPAAPPRPQKLPSRFGRYRIDHLLGEGGMGAVYLAEDTQLERRVALKVPHFSPEEGSDVLQRFHREARTLATILHANICPLYDVGEIDGIPYLTMAYIEGKLLWEYIAGGRPLVPRQAAALVRKIAIALQEAHKHGVVHRDLKPSNIIINKSGEPIVMDFGLARRMDHPSQRLTKTGVVLGTVVYMPPEQVTGNTALMGPTTDIYSLGVILYELLTAKPPYEGTPAEMVMNIVLGGSPRVRERRPEISRKLDAICAKAMAKEIPERYPTMAALAAALTDYLRDESQPAPAPTAGRGAVAQAASPASPRPAAKPAAPAGKAPPRRLPVAQMPKAAVPAAARPPAKVTPPPVPARKRVTAVAAQQQWWRKMPLWVWIAGGVGAVVVVIVAFLLIRG